MSERGAQARAELNQQAQWQGNLVGLVQQHRRKCSLLPRLEALLNKADSSVLGLKQTPAEKH
jgi:hypothetical protein